MTVADRVLSGLGPAFTELAGPLLPDLVTGLVSGLERTDQLLQPTAGGWATAFDLPTTPDPTWLGQASGTLVPPGLTLEQTRDYVAARPRWGRGRPPAIIAAVQALLTGTKHVELLERSGSPWRLTIRVYAAEYSGTLDDLKAAVNTQKPVGIVATVLIVAGASFQHFIDHHGPTFADDRAAFPTFLDAYIHIEEP